MGHATLFVRSERASILCDPIFGNAVSGGGNVIHPQRTFSTEHLPWLDAVCISHHHSDHFSLPDLALIPEIKTKRILAPEGSEIIEKLCGFGCCGVEPLRVGRPVSVGDITITPTPSSVDFPEVGFFFEAGGATALNLVDTQFHDQVNALITIVGRGVHLVLAPFQSGGYMSLLPLRVGGPPAGLVDLIETWSVAHTQELVADLLLLQPGHVVPFADGLLYRDDDINAWHFPKDDDFFLDLLAREGVSASQWAPGQVFTVSASGIADRGQFSHLVRAAPVRGNPREFNPDVQLNDIPVSCATWNHSVQDYGGGPWSKLQTLIESQLVARRSEIDARRADFLGWFLEFCDVPHKMVYFTAVSEDDEINFQFEQDRPVSREYGLRLHASDFLHLIEGRIELDQILLGGAFRYHSPFHVDDLERIRGRVLTPLYAILGIA
jgi:L-ascorbate metabolism protein UlaG (beta-lactamase superfamily)